LINRRFSSFHWNINAQLDDFVPACTKCERRGQYKKATLIERYRADANMVDLRLTLAAGCPKIAANKIMDLCGVYYPDRIGT
jgi:hypothetical protein